MPSRMLLQKYSHHVILLLIAIGLSITFVLFWLIESILFTTILRALAGLFGAPTWLIMITLSGQHFGNDKVSLFTGCASICSYFLILIFLTIQGYVYQLYGSCRATYYVLGLLGFLTVVAIIFTMHAQKRKIQQPKTLKSENHNQEQKDYFQVQIPTSTAKFEGKSKSKLKMQDQFEY